MTEKRKLERKMGCGRAGEYFPLFKWGENERGKKTVEEKWVDLMSHLSRYMCVYGGNAK